MNFKKNNFLIGLCLLMTTFSLTIKAEEISEEVQIQIQDELELAAPEPPPGAPIDSNLFLLKLTGVLFVGYFYYKKNKKLLLKNNN